MEPRSLTPHQILLVRHGATAWSRDGRHTGRTNIPLLDQGETEARQLRSKLLGLLQGREPVVFSSPLARALDTCRLAGFGSHVELDDDLMEWDYGEYEGCTTAEIQKGRPGWELFRDGCPGGETLSEVAARVSGVLCRLRHDERLVERPALLFAHGHVLRVLTAVWASFGPAAGRSLPMATGAVGILGWTHAEPALERWNV